MSYALDHEDYNDIILDDMGAPIAKFDRTQVSRLHPNGHRAVNGDPEAIWHGFAQRVFGPDPVQLYIANHVGYSSDVVPGEPWRRFG